MQESQRVERISSSNGLRDTIITLLGLKPNEVSQARSSGTICIPLRFHKQPRSLAGNSADYTRLELWCAPGILLDRDARFYSESERKYIEENKFVDVICKYQLPHMIFVLVHNRNEGITPAVVDLETETTT